MVRETNESDQSLLFKLLPLHLLQHFACDYTGIYRQCCSYEFCMQPPNCKDYHNTKKVCFFEEA